MKIFFDTNVYVAEAIMGKAARQILEATRRGRWRIYASSYVATETSHVLADDFGFSKRLAALTERRILHRSTLVEGQTRARVPDDPKDSPILQAALLCGADYLVSNDKHLLTMDPFESLRIISMNTYRQILLQHGLL
jgi:putative PIN family toxin of toxin-antitoxin system